MHALAHQRTYLVFDERVEKYALLADDASTIYPAQFDKAFPVILQD